jgi:hypothetical protein
LPGAGTLSTNERFRVAQKQYQVWLSETMYIAVDFATVLGRVVSFVVRLMVIEGDKEHGIARYDTAHGAPHRDRLSRRGTLMEKVWLLGLDLDSALNYAVEDFKKNYENYYQAWK